MKRNSNVTEHMNEMPQSVAICYLKPDRDFALKMQKFIESYKLPSAVSKNCAGARKPASVICSEIRVSGDVLTEMPEFSQADYLILLCSEEFAKQDLMYLDYDLRTFMERKWEEGVNPATRIIPVVISGEQDCRPLAIKTLGTDCPDVILRSKLKSDREVFLHVISSLLGFAPPTFANLERKNRNFVRMAMAALLVLVIGFGLLYVKLSVPFKRHYLDFTMQYGVPQGIHPLSGKEQERAAAHYVITEKNGRVISLEYINAYGRRIDHDASCWRTGNRPSAYLFEYDGSELKTVTYEDRFGKPYFVMEYHAPNQVQLKDSYDRAVPYYIGEDLSCNPGILLKESELGAQPHMSAFFLEYSDEGYVSQVLFQRDVSGSLCGDDNVYGIAYVRDEKGRVIEKHYLDAQEEPTANRMSVAAVCYGFNDADCYTELMFLDMDGELTSNGRGDIHLVMTYDDNSNLVSRSSLNRNDAELSYVEYKLDDRGNLLHVNSKEYVYDDRGYILEERWLDPYGMLLNAGAYSASKIQYIRDEKGNVLVESYYDAEGNPVYTKDNYGRIINTYNHLGQLTSRSYWNGEGTEQVCTERGYSSEVTTYDDRGRITSVAYFDTEGQPTVLREGALNTQYHKKTIAYEDGLRQKVTTCFFDTQGRLVDMTDTTYACIERVVENGELLLLQFTRSDGSIYAKIEQEPSVNEHGEREVIQRQFDESGKKVVVTVYRANGVPLSKTGEFYNIDGILNSEITMTYFESGAESFESALIYDEQGKADMLIQITYTKYGEIAEYRIEELE